MFLHVTFYRPNYMSDLKPGDQVHWEAPVFVSGPVRPMEHRAGGRGAADEGILAPLGIPASRHLAQPCGKPPQK